MRVLGIPARLTVVHARIVLAGEPHLALRMHLHVLAERCAVAGRLGRSGDEEPRACQGEDSCELCMIVHLVPLHEWVVEEV